MKLAEKAGIVIMVIIAIVVFSYMHRGNERELYDYPPAIMWNDRLYWFESKYADNNNIGDKLGEITSLIDYGIPTQNGESNCYNIGSAIYAYGGDDNRIVVQWDNTFMVLKNTDGKS